MKKNEDTEALPETGGAHNNNGTLFGGLLAGLGAIFLVGRRRKKDNEQ
ncbi:LPXTG cell wall anchor domain-containing protein [Staphylococcus sp. 11261D007BR]